MRTIINTLAAVAVSLSLTLASATVAHAADKPTPAATKAKVDWKMVEQHLREHQQYPASKADLVAACNNLVDFKKSEKQWFAATLPDRTYQSADEVLAALRGK